MLLLNVDLDNAPIDIPELDSPLILSVFIKCYFIYSLNGWRQSEKYF